MTHTLTISTEHGDVLITEEELPSITPADLKILGVKTLDELRQLFAEGVERMRGRTESERVRAVADQHLDGTWEVNVVRYSSLNDPLMNDPKGRA